MAQASAVVTQSAVGTSTQMPPETAIFGMEAVLFAQPVDAAIFDKLEERKVTDAFGRLFRVLALIIESAALGIVPAADSWNG